MKLESVKYAGRVITIFGEPVSFSNNGIAEVSDELGTKILSANFPNVFEEGKVPAKKSQAELMLEGELSEKEMIAKNEIARLNSLIHESSQKIIKLTNEVVMWKSMVDKMKPLLSNEQLKSALADSPVEKQEEEKQQKEDTDYMRKKLEGEKKDVVVEHAKQLGISDAALLDADGKVKTKEEIINLILAEVQA